MKKLAAILAAVLVTASYVGVYRYARLPKPVSAVGLAACGQLLGVVIVNSDGSQKRLTADEVVAEIETIKKLPQKHTSTLVLPNSLCHAAPQVY